MVRKGFPEEYPISLVLNGQELATYQLTKSHLEDWAIGYLFSEDVIQSADDIKNIQFHEELGKINVVLNEDIDIKEVLRKQKHFTAGCGKGITFFSMTDVKNFPKITSKKTVKMSYLFKKMFEFSQASVMYKETGGMHGGCLIHEDGSITVREDIGRHNAVDKVIGYAVREKLDPDSLILLTSGRISYEMLSKCAMFGISIIGSRTTPTKQAVQLANYLNIEIVAYIKGRMAKICTKHNRVIDDVIKKAD